MKQMCYRTRSDTIHPFNIRGRKILLPRKTIESSTPETSHFSKMSKKCENRETIDLSKKPSGAPYLRGRNPKTCSGSEFFTLAEMGQRFPDPSGNPKSEFLNFFSGGVGGGSKMQGMKNPGFLSILSKILFLSIFMFSE